MCCSNGKILPYAGCFSSHFLDLMRLLLFFLCSVAGLLLSAAAQNKRYKLTVGSVGPLIVQDIHLQIAQACTLYPASCCLFCLPCELVPSCGARSQTLLAHLTGPNCARMDQRGLLRTLAQCTEGRSCSIILAVQTAVHCSQPVSRITEQFGCEQHRHLEKDQQGQG